MVEERGLFRRAWNIAKETNLVQSLRREYTEVDLVEFLTHAEDYVRKRVEVVGYAEIVTQRKELYPVASIEGLGEERKTAYRLCTTPYIGMGRVSALVKHRENSSYYALPDSYEGWALVKGKVKKNRKSGESPIYIKASNVHPYQRIM
jgi:hypothetical protein